MDYLSLALFNLLPIAILLVLNCRLIITLRRVVDQDARRSSAATTSTSAAVNARNTDTEAPELIVINQSLLETENGDILAIECEVMHLHICV